jgi:hypothetical protein
VDGIAAEQTSEKSNSDESERLGLSFQEEIKVDEGLVKETQQQQRSFLQ